jgi:hypothetical protein
VKTKVFNAIRSTSKVDCDSAAWNKIGGEARVPLHLNARVGWYTDPANAMKVETQIIAVIAKLDYDGYTLQHFGVRPNEAAAALVFSQIKMCFPPSRKTFLFHNGC